MKNILVLFLLIQSSLFAQLDGGSFDPTSMFGDEIQQKLGSQKMMGETSIPVGSTVDPDVYKVGPGDIYTIKILPTSPIEEKVVVSPEGQLILPRSLGKIDVKNKTINQLRVEIQELANQNLEGSELIFSLYKARTCMVRISGNVLFPSIYNLPASFRVSNAIDFANHSAQENRLEFIQLELKGKYRKDKQNREYFGSSGVPNESVYHRRNINLVREDGSIERVDLELAIAAGKSELDPYISQGDQIIVPEDEDVYSWVAVGGAVVRPAKIHFKQGDMASDLIKMGFGFTDEADLSNIEIRFPDSKSYKLYVDENMKVLGKDYLLESGCLINVPTKQSKVNDLHGIVSIKGMVNKPGNYVITNNFTTLKQVVEMAGGVQDEAYLPLARIYTKNDELQLDNDPYYDRLRLFQYSDLTIDDTMRVNIDALLKRPFASVNFENELVSENGKVTLQDGDVIEIPRAPHRVYVFGKVKNPGFVKFEEGKSMDWYINMAGGMTQAAEADRARIIRGATYVWIEPNENTYVLDGDLVYVPSEPDVSSVVQIQKYAAYAGIAGAVVALINSLYFIYNTQTAD